MDKAEQSFTHHVSLVISSDFGSYTYWQERAGDVARDTDPAEYQSWHNSLIYDLADALKEEYTGQWYNALDATNDPTFRELVTHAMGYVSWPDVARDIVGAEDCPDEWPDGVSGAYIDYTKNAAK